MSLEVWNFVFPILTIAVAILLVNRYRLGRLRSSSWWPGIIVYAIAFLVLAFYPTDGLYWLNAFMVLSIFGPVLIAVLIHIAWTKLRH